MLWGRAYVATLAGAEHNGGVITRDGTYEPGCGSCLFPTAPPRPLAEEAQLSWIAQVIASATATPPPPASPPPPSHPATEPTTTTTTISSSSTSSSSPTATITRAQEAHLPRVWLIAETAAAAMGADQAPVP